MSQSQSDQEIIKYLVKFLKGGHAYAPLSKILENIPKEHRGARSKDVPHSIWQLVEHIRIAQWDIIDFSRNPDYKEIKWPDNYWPEEAYPASDADWDKSVEQIFKDRDDLIEMLENPDVDLYTPFPWGNGQNLLREALLVIDHNSHHAGQIILMRRLLGDWK